MSLILRSKKGAPLTAEEHDNNLEYLRRAPGFFMNCLGTPPDFRIKSIHTDQYPNGLYEIETPGFYYINTNAYGSDLPFTQYGYLWVWQKDANYKIQMAKGRSVGGINYRVCNGDHTNPANWSDWKQLAEMDDVDPDPEIDLVYDQTFDRGAVNISIGMSDCNDVEVVATGGTGSTMYGGFNSDFGNSNYRRAATQCGSGTGNWHNYQVPILFNNGDSNGHTYLWATKDGKYIHKERARNDDTIPEDPIDLYSFAYRWKGASSVSTFNISCSWGFTGRIRIWKRY